MDNNRNEIVENESYEKTISKKIVVFKDSDGEPVFIINDKGKTVFTERKDDHKYRLINKYDYQLQIGRLIEEQKENLKENLDFYKVGLMLGYELAYDCCIPYLRYEICKANKTLETFENDDFLDLFQSDKHYLIGFVDALTKAMDIQRENVFCRCNWDISVVFHNMDFYELNDFEFEQLFFEYGLCKVEFFSEIPQEINKTNNKQIVIVIAPKGTANLCRDVYEKMILPPEASVEITYCKDELSKKSIITLIEKVLGKECVLGAGDEYYRIDEAIVADIIENIYCADGDRKIKYRDIEIIDDISEVDLKSELECSVEPYEFKENEMLKTIKLPNNIKEIPEGMFYGCYRLNYVRLPRRVNAIGISAFEGCKSLEGLFMPDTIKSISSRAFFDCSGLQKIYLSEQLEYIGSKAFYGCIKIRELYIPPNVVFVAEDAFDKCLSLNEIVAPIGLQLPSQLKERINIKYYSKTF